MRNRFKIDSERDNSIYLLPYEKEEKRKTHLANLALAGVLTVLLVLVGMVNQPSSRTFWVVYPYLFIYLPVIYLWRGVVCYLGCDSKISGSLYDKGIRRIRHSVWGILILSAVAAVCDVVYVVLYHGQMENVGRELLYLAGLAVLAVVGVFYGFCYDRMFSGIIQES